MSAWYCIKCGKRVSEDMLKCPYCGCGTFIIGPDPKMEAERNEGDKV